MEHELKILKETEFSLDRNEYEAIRNLIINNNTAVNSGFFIVMAIQFMYNKMMLFDVLLYSKI